IGSTKTWEQSPLWTTIDEPMKGFKTAADNSRVIGFAGPPSAKATEVYTKYVIIDMYAKGVQGTKAEDSVKRAASELGKICGWEMEKPLGGGSGGPAGLATTLERPHELPPRRLTRWLESERLLATLLLAPALILLGLFIAYPFVMGVWLSLSS